MHFYSLDTEIRRTVYVILAIGAFLIPSFFETIRTFFCGLPENFGIPLSFGAIFGLFNFLFNKYLWKYLPQETMPDLNGEWLAEGVSSYEDPETGENARFEMTVTIKQTFTKIEIFTDTKESTSRSTMASISTQHAKPMFMYSYQNMPKNTADRELQRHPGLIELRIDNKDQMEGDYFSGQHRLRFGQLSLKRKTK